MSGGVVSTETLAAVDRALEARGEIVLRLQAEDTDAYRLFHGVAEGVPGLTVDRYGPLVLVQTFRAPLSERTRIELEEHLRGRLAHGFELVYNHRGKQHDEPFELWHRPRESALATFECRERGVRYAIRARHRGLDPWLFLDLRAGRRRLAELAPGKRVANLFAYTCSAGIAAACAGSIECWNVDFAASGLEVGRDNARRNDVEDRMRFVEEDFFPVARQLAGMPVKGRASRRPFARFEPQRFDVVFLDPPAWSKGPFGAVDVVGDYASLFKPALLATEVGGVVLATNHAAEVDRETWLRTLVRAAEKAGRPLRSIELVEPEPDFPAFDGRPPLKIACCRT